MNDARPTAARQASGADTSEATQLLRHVGALAHQLRAATRAADHYNAQDAASDRDTGSWLMSCAVTMAADVAAELDGLARAVKERAVDAALLQRLSALRIRAHQLHAAARAADHFLDQDSLEDLDTGTWLIATAHALAVKLAAEADDSVSATRRVAPEKAAELHDPTPARRVGGAGSKPFWGAGG